MSVLDYLEEELRSLEERGLRRRMRPVDSDQGPIVQVDGVQAINFSSNNYLGIANAPELRDAAAVALGEEGFGSGASRLIVGNLRAHRRLEQELAAFHEVEATLLFNSGYQANVGVLSALAGADDVIFSDELNHASLIDGCRLSRARVEVFPHRDLGTLERRLRDVAGRRRFIVTDTVFSMDGELAPLADLRSLADRHRAALVVDEAHATAAVGPGGRGLAAARNVRPDVHIGTLSKGFGSFGAYIAGRSSLIEYLANRARSFVFSTALPPSVAAGALAAVRLVRGPRGDELRKRLAQRIEQFATGLRLLGLSPGQAAVPIFPVRIGDDRRTMAASERLLALGVYAQGIRPPTVPPRTARLRFSLMATHEAEHVDRALAALRTLLDEGLLSHR